MWKSKVRSFKNLSQKFPKKIHNWIGRKFHFYLWLLSTKYLENLSNKREICRTHLFRINHFLLNPAYCYLPVFFQTGDEMSKRAKFVLVTWVGQNVSVMKKAKMSTDKALMKDIIQVSTFEMIIIIISMPHQFPKLYLYFT